MAEMRSSLGLELQVAFELKDRETELGFGPQVWTPDGLLLSCVVLPHRGLVRRIAHSGMLPGSALLRIPSGG